ncbi:MAG: hypothetical protein H7A46_17155 [Verrucomicrobiales bacterium]|nr:hypothetical protein [Verrucomicrobiales bacterium]
MAVFPGGDLAFRCCCCQFAGVATLHANVKTSQSSGLLGKGIYTVPDASRLSRVSQRRIRYWLKGLPTEKTPEPKTRPLWFGELHPINDKLALGFLDLQEVRFIDAFLKTGVSWPLLRSAHAIARQRYATEHPFCTRRFVTDGAQIIEEIATGRDGVAYEEVVRGQRVFQQVIQPFLRELEFADDDQLVRWWPLGSDRAVVLDPKRQFGQPITSTAGVATEVLQAAAKAGQAVEEIADWFDLDVRSVRDALEFEQRLAA